MRAPLDGLDLNLLVTLQALLHESSVTRAATRLGQSQPTVSRSLSTLRTAFGDPLLVRAGRGMALTPFAHSLERPLRRALSAIDHLRGVGGFVPERSARVFRLALPDVLANPIVPRLLERFGAGAPTASLVLVGTERDALRALLDDDVELVVGATPLQHPELFGQVVASAFSWSVVCAEALADTVRTVDGWLGLPHVQLVPSGRPDTPGLLDRALSASGRERQVVLRLSHVSALPLTLASGRLVASLPTPIARVVAGSTLAVVPHPLGTALPGLELRTSWREAHQTDAGHAWFRTLVADVVRSLEDP
ncbi:MAG: LysR family transcriptional regulator [Myxococcota bacterium]